MLSEAIDAMARGIKEIPPKLLRSTALLDYFYFEISDGFLSVDAYSLYNLASFYVSFAVKREGLAVSFRRFVHVLS